MPPHLHIDFETFSKEDIKKVGAYRYAYGETEILCCAFSLGDEEPAIWDCRMDGFPSELEKYLDALEDESIQVWAHNAQFEMAICQALLPKTWGIPCPALSRFRCTMSLARRAALPAKLDTLAETLGLKNLKDNRGKALIRKFSMMQKGARVSKKNPEGGKPFRIRPQDDPSAFAEFLEYCKQDVRAEQEVARRLAYFDEPINNSSYTLHEVINARGVSVNLTALRHAQTLINDETEIVGAAFRKLTGIEFTQGEKFLEWLKSERVDLPDLQAATIEEYLEEHDK